MTIFTARYRTVCDNCQERIKVGDCARHDGRQVVHAACPDPIPPVATDQPPPRHHFDCALVTRGGGCTCGAIDYQQTADHVGDHDA